MRKRKMEGVMAKDIESLYYPGKRRSIWTKIKSYNSLEAVIIGYTRKKRILSSLVLGMYTNDGDLRYIGKVGTGFTDKLIREIVQQLKPLKRVHPADQSLASEVPRATQKVIQWVKPQFVCEIKYVEFTSGGILRTPVFLRMRPDRRSEDITFKEQQIRV